MNRQLQTERPFRDVINLSDELGRLFWGMGQVPGEGETEQPVAWSPAVDARSFSLPTTVDTSAIQAKMKDGIEAKAREVNVEIG